MLVSTAIELLDYRFGREKAIRLVAEAGFDAFDMSLFGMVDVKDEFCGDDWRVRAEGYRRLADELGIVCNQAHAPFPSSVIGGTEADNEQRFERIVRAMEIAAILGAKAIVIHPVQHMPYPWHVEELKQLNKIFYARLLPYAEKFGIDIATENMWQDVRSWVLGGYLPADTADEGIIEGPCAPAEEFAEYVDMMAHDRMVACLDIGHAPLVGRDPAELIRTLGHRLEALHIHDVDGKQDLHTIPFVSVGEVDFDAVTTALAEVGYAGDITFEVARYYLRVPDALIPAALTYLCEVGRYIRSEVERKKK